MFKVILKGDILSKEQTIKLLSEKARVKSRATPLVLLALRYFSDQGEANE